MRRKLTDLANQRTAQLTAAQTALEANDQAAYDAAMEQIRNLNTEMQRIQDLIAEQDRQVLSQQPTPGEARDMAEERGSILMRGDAVNFSATEIRRAFNQVTLATGTIVEPTGAGSTIRDSLNGTVSSIVDQVYVQDLTGMGAFLEPYVITELEANGGKVTELAGKARTASTDPTFGVAEIRPYELNVTSFVDRNISRLSPASYYDKIYGMAMRALRRKIAAMIVGGDGAASPTMYGIVNAKNKAGAAIYAEKALSAINETTLDELYFAYGSSEEMGPSARLLLTKPNLKALGALRGANEKRRLLEITPDTGNPNTGVIRDGGLVLPFTLCGDVGDGNLLYGDPLNYELGLFGEFSIRVDESVKAVERMVAVLGDVFVGGNLIVDKGFVVGKVGGSAAG
ncbi:phage major capsid protein [uncultured Dysosmobacter sp.]|uniref:phage major capsid protein n=1 Tax=uncultured Dysosmobacter sp. TaxID=2591384 RepID=UPI00260FA4BB|nr:phage major capsid protein [uncultured Dysosmobacter sp.]